VLVVVVAVGLLSGRAIAADAKFQIAGFSVDVTPPMGSPLLGWAAPPVKGVDDPLSAVGFVFFGSGKPIVFLSVDWLEIRNDSYDYWKSQVADAAGTTPDRVLISCVHQHDAPFDDINSQKVVEAAGIKEPLTDVKFCRETVLKVAKAVQDAVQKPRPVTHIGLGQAEVKKVASNRRYLGSDGKLYYNRSSDGASRNAAIRESDPGTIDPFLKTISFWNGDKPVLAMHAFATHPMSYYRKGRVSCDFPGIARNRRQSEQPDVLQVYFSGASGNITAGKYNDGNPANRPVLADRLYQAMANAWQNTKRQPIQTVELRSVPMLLPIDPRPMRELGKMRKDVTDPKTGKTLRMLAALGVAWRERRDAGYAVALPVVDFGPAQFLLLPGESYVEFQLMAQQLRPDSFVMVAGYGECGTGYVAIERAWQEKDGNLNDWCYTGPGSEKVMRDAMSIVLKATK
jgi:hypothetical protein